MLAPLIELLSIFSGLHAPEELPHVTKYRNETVRNHSQVDVTFNFQNIQELLVLKLHPGVFVAIGQYGEVAAFKTTNAPESVQELQRTNITIPFNVGYRGGIWHAALDETSDRMYFTVVEKIHHRASIFYCDGIIASLLGNPSIGQLALKPFATPSNPSNFRFNGLAYDSKRKTLYAAENHLHDPAKYPGRIVAFNLVSNTNSTVKTGSVKLIKPWACAVHENALAISDQISNSIILLNIQGKGHNLVGVVAKTGSRLGEVQDPWGLTFEHVSGSLLVADRGNKRFQLFEKDSWQPLWQSQQMIAYPKTGSIVNKTAIVGALYPSKIAIMNY